MSLTLSLNNALSGLNVNQQSLSVLSQNIANANTPGYSKQNVNQQAVYVDGSGAGVNVEAVTRKVDQYLVGAVQQQGAVVGQANTLSSYNQNIQLLMGQPGAENSIDAYVNNFTSALQSLAQTPQNTSLQETAVNSGVSLASQMSSLAQGLQTQQFQADQDIGTAVSQVNNDLQQLAQVNGAITAASSIGESIAGFQDQQDKLLNDVSQYISISTYTKQSGAINVTTSSGVPLLDDNLYQLNYLPISSASGFSEGGSLSPLTVTRVDQNLNPVGPPVTLLSGGPAGQQQQTNLLGTGQINALVTMRDQQIPAILSQLDNLAYTVADQVNQIQNSGTSYPGANSFTGTRLVGAQQTSQWSGSVQIAVLDQNGQPIPSVYPGQTGGVPPLTLNLASLNSGTGQGNPNVQTIINAINQYYGPQQNKAQLGNLDNIQLASDSPSLPGIPGQFSFDFNLSNLSSTASNFFVTGVQVLDDQGNNITSLTQNVPTVALANVNTYTTTAGSPVVTVNTAAPSGLKNGETVYLSTPNSAPNIDGIPSADLGGYFTISNVTSTSFQVTAATSAATGTNVSVSNQTAEPPYAQVAAGTSARTNSSGVITTALSNSLSQYYTVNATVGVQNADGTISTSTITYRVPNQTANTLNNLYPATAVSGDGTLNVPTSNAPIATAMLVDANGNQLPMVNGQYTTAQQGYLEIKANNSTYNIAINSLNSAQQGSPNGNPPIPGTNRGFSYYFDLNDFFQTNQPTASGNAVTNSALNMAVEQRLQADPSLITTGSLTPTANSNDPTNPTYTYEVNAGDNSVIQKMANLGSLTVAFNAAGGQGPTSTSLAGYAGGIVANVATQAATTQSNQTNAQNLLDGFTQQAATVSGVNLDTELANTVIYQNAYAASARVITVTSTLFDSLLSAFPTS